MKAKPYFFNILALFLFICALGFPLQVAIIDGHSLFNTHELAMIFYKLSPLNKITILFLLITTFLAYIGHHTLKYLLPLTIFIVIINNASVGLYTNEFNSFVSLGIIETSLASTFFCIITGVLVFTKGGRILFRPDLRWWRIARRYTLSLDVNIKLANSDQSPTLQTFDISPKGLYIPTYEDETIKLIKENFDQEFEIEVNDHKNELQKTFFAKLFKNNQYHLQVRPVRVTSHKKGLYPAGVGLKIIGGKWQDRLAWFFKIKGYSIKV